MTVSDAFFVFLPCFCLFFIEKRRKSENFREKRSISEIVRESQRLSENGILKPIDTPELKPNFASQSNPGGVRKSETRWWVIAAVIETSSRKPLALGRAQTSLALRSLMRSLTYCYNGIDYFVFSTHTLFVLIFCEEGGGCICDHSLQLRSVTN